MHAYFGLVSFACFVFSFLMAASIKDNSEIISAALFICAAMFLTTGFKLLSQKDWKLMLHSERFAYRNQLAEMSKGELDKERKTFFTSEKINKSVGDINLTYKFSSAELLQREKLILVLLEEKNRKNILTK